MGPGESPNPQAAPASWQILLAGEAREKALNAIGYIARALAEPPPAWIPGFDAEPFRIARGISLGSGSPALALFYAYQGRSLGPDSSSAQQMTRNLEYTGTGLEVARLESGFMNGLPGVLWALDHIAALTEEPLEGLAEAMVQADSFLEEHTLAEEGFDLWRGLVGHGVYALPRVDEPAARRLLESLLDRLLSELDPDPEAPPWTLHPRLLKKPDRAGVSLPHTQLGVAHGLAGMIAFLAEAHRHGLGAGEIPAVCDRTWRWLDARKCRDDLGIYWPNVVGTGIAPSRGIEKWCNGMPGIAAALLAVAHKLGHAEMRKWSLDRAREMAEYTRTKARPTEVSLCHGSAGLAHVYNRIFQQTGDEFFADTARFYLQLTLDLQVPGYGVGGFTAYGRGPAGDFGDLFDPGLMVGSSGVGLALLAAVTNQAPHWDRCLLLS